MTRDMEEIVDRAEEIFDKIADEVIKESNDYLQMLRFVVDNFNLNKEDVKIFKKIINIIEDFVGEETEETEEKEKESEK